MNYLAIPRRVIRELPDLNLSRITSGLLGHDGHDVPNPIPMRFRTLTPALDLAQQNVRRIEEQDQLDVRVQSESYQFAQSRALVARHRVLAQPQLIQRALTSGRACTYLTLHHSGEVLGHVLVCLQMLIVATEIPQPFWSHRRPLALQTHGLARRIKGGPREQDSAVVYSGKRRVRGARSLVCA